MADDFGRMRSASINAIRTYHVPPDTLLDLAQQHGLWVLVDVPWPKHLCFLEDEKTKREARQLVGAAATQLCGHPRVIGLSIANEIPSDVVRWHGARHIERFLGELADVAHQNNPEVLLTYASYPPTEYLGLDFVDFATFNVYLHDLEAFRRYLLRLMNLVGEKPLVLGELGMDTLRHGEIEQADFLTGQLREASLLGLAGAFVFSWTDEWHTGGHTISDWAFGITEADRWPKASYHALRELFEQPPSALLDTAPRVSVVVCTYNGGRTLEQCLRSLAALEYPDYEVIVVDDGSTDETSEILARFPEVRAIRQHNEGLSTARNVGLQAATGSIVAYTDSDCYADPRWLKHLVDRLERSGAAGVGGPNLSPDDGWLAACVAASPGQPMHVLESDQVAEHIPGCNMAFRREALLAINGFDPVFRKAGDDVDLCWRLQQAGCWITFAPGAWVWHHRRQNPRSYLRQQAGYGQAEALLRFKHPDRFNGRGDGKWRGSLYGASLQGLRLAQPLIYRGTFGTGMFQCLYQPGPAHWAMLPNTLEWLMASLLVALCAVWWLPAFGIALGMVGLTLIVAALQASQAKLEARYDRLTARMVVMALCCAQPLIRSWTRYQTRLFSYRKPEGAIAPPGALPGRFPLRGVLIVSYWDEHCRDRIELLDRAVANLTEDRWGKVIDAGWSEWDLEVSRDPWTLVQINSVQEEHGGGKRLIRLRYRLKPDAVLRCALALALAAVCVGGATGAPLAFAVAVALLAFYLGSWWHGARAAMRVAGVFDRVATAMGLVRVFPVKQAEVEGTSDQRAVAVARSAIRWPSWPRRRQSHGQSGAFGELEG